MSTKKVQLPVRLRPSTKKMVEEAARIAEMTQSAYIAKAVEEKLERERIESV